MYKFVYFENVAVFLQGLLKFAHGQRTCCTKWESFLSFFVFNSNKENFSVS